MASGSRCLVDKFGRIKLPHALYLSLRLEASTPFEVFVDEDDYIILRKYNPACVFCGSMDGVMDFRGKNVCRHCAEELAQVLSNQVPDQT